MKDFPVNKEAAEEISLLDQIKAAVLALVDIPMVNKIHLLLDEESMDFIELAQKDNGNILVNICVTGAIYEFEATEAYLMDIIKSLLNL